MVCNFHSWRMSFAVQNKHKNGPVHFAAPSQDTWDSTSPTHALTNRVPEAALQNWDSKHEWLETSCFQLCFRSWTLEQSGRFFVWATLMTLVVRSNREQILKESNCGTWSQSHHHHLDQPSTQDASGKYRFRFGNPCQKMWCHRVDSVLFFYQAVTALFQQHLDKHGLNLKDLATLGALLENMVHSEADVLWDEFLSEDVGVRGEAVKILWIRST